MEVTFSLIGLRPPINNMTVSVHKEQTIIQAALIRLTQVYLNKIMFIEINKHVPKIP